MHDPLMSTLRILPLAALLLLPLGCNLRDELAAGDMASGSDTDLALPALLDMPVIDAAPDLRDDLDTACVPLSREALCQREGAQCGPLSQVDDGCGHLVDLPQCGTCGSGERCELGACAPECAGETAQKLCDEGGARCGALQVTDACGNARELDCGECSDTHACAQNQCVCLPEPDQELCQMMGAQCGPLSIVDRCGLSRQPDCGTCESAGSAAFCMDNLCACTPESDEALCGKASAQCGTITVIDGCNQPRTIACGTCLLGLACSDQNTCPQCQPLSDAALCAQQGRSCGPLQVMDDCGQMRQIASCGPCEMGRQCDEAAGLCACPAPSCAGVPCGTVTNACGSSSACADTCNSATQQCVANACACKPESDAELCVAAGATCGSITRTDRCGTSRTVTCGTCAGGATCTGLNTCCTPESNQQLCDDDLRECGPYNTLDACGQIRSIPSCGVCDDLPGGRCRLGPGICY